MRAACTSIRAAGRHQPRPEGAAAARRSGATDELYECFDTWFPGAGIEYYYYDQLGSFRSDQPDDPALWDLAC